MDPWWKGAVIYQIYPRSFFDTNGDGIGDLEGIRQKLDYIAGLGVDAIWLSPIYPSPDRDFGYDVADYCDVDPKFGSLEDFDRLLADVHERGMRLILDQVLSHTSDEHPWFKDSLLGGDKKDWYVWADPRDDGTAPNNWLSAFGGPAWAYHPVRRQYYHHKFYREQPKLNLHLPEARKAALDVLRFWLDRGVDGFRLDVANTYLHDEALTDNPPIPPSERGGLEWSHPPRMQRHIHDANREENAEVLREIRTIADDYPDAFVFGEFSEEPDLLPKFVGDDVLHSGYTFDFLDDRGFDPKVFEATYSFLARHPHIWPCVTFSNHDSVRTVTRYGNRKPGEGGDPALAKLAIALLLCLKGTVLLYQGEELGLDEGDIVHRESIKDPLGDLYFPFFKGRDGARTPMPWSSGAPQFGFTTGQPWLAPSPSHGALCAADQLAQPDSVVQFTQAALKARSALPPLIRGTVEEMTVQGSLLSFKRTLNGDVIQCHFNLARDGGAIDLKVMGGEVIAALSPGYSSGSQGLPARSGVVLQCR